LKQIILIRHAQATNNLPNSVKGGWSDVELTELGIRQAEAVAERLSNELEGNIPVYSSDLRRARQTVEIICKRLEAIPLYVLELREHNAGIASGMNRKKAEKLWVNKDTPTLDTRPWPEAESWGEFYTRVSTFMDKLCITEESVLIVSHGGTIRNIIRWWLGIPRSDHFKVSFDTANTSVTVLDTPDNVRRVERLNDTAHYATIGITNPIR
jgi:probable phosphoglycerate mutase